MNEPLIIDAEIAYHQKLDPTCKLIWTFIRHLGTRELSEGGAGSVRIPNIDIGKKLNISPKRIDTAVGYLIDAGLFLRTGQSIGRRLTAITPATLMRAYEANTPPAQPPTDTIDVPQLLTKLKTELHHGN